MMQPGYNYQLQVNRLSIKVLMNCLIKFHKVYSRLKSFLELMLYCYMSCRLKINLVLSCLVGELSQN